MGKCKKSCILKSAAETVNIPGDNHRGSARDMKGEGILFVGEAPGREEDAQGQVFVGPTGRFIRQFIDKTIPDVPVRFENAVRCYPNGLDVRSGLEPCRSKLMIAIRKCNPGRIVALGRTALEALTGYQLPVTQVTGGWAWVDIPKHKPLQVSIVPHPSTVLHNASTKIYWETMMRQVLLSPPDPEWNGTSVGGIRTIEVRSKERAKKVFKLANKARVVGLDTEYNDRTNRLLCVAIAFGPNKAYSFPHNVCKKKWFRRMLERLFANPRVRMAAHNWKFDAHVLERSIGVSPYLFTNPDMPWLDTSSLRKIYDPEQLSRLELADWMVGLGGHKEEMYGILRGQTGPAYEKAYDENPEIVLRYCCYDALACWRLVKYYGRVLKQEKLLPVWEEVMGPIGPALFQMETHGIRVDVDAMDALDENLSEELDLELTMIRESSAVKRLVKAGVVKPIASGPDKGKVLFNPRSTDQKRELMFGAHGLGLKSVGTTAAGGAKTDRGTITYFAESGGKRLEVLTYLDQYNRIAHKKSTYVDGYRKRLIERPTPDGVQYFVCPNYRQDGTTTGRLSCQNPNAQNIPNRGRPEDLAIRRMFLPLTDDDVMMEVDYSQIEMRLAAELSGDEAMMHCFLNDIDIHRKTASEVTGKAVEEITKEERQKAKPVNFGLIFNMSAKGLQRYAFSDYGVEMTLDEAEAWRRSFFRLYSTYRRWMLRELAVSRRRGCAFVYWLGLPFRRRWLPGLGSKKYGARGHAERQVINTPIQGGASEYTLRSIIALHRMWRAGKLPHVTGVFATIHDSILLSVKRGKTKSTFKKVGRVMVSHPTRRVPLGAEAKVGPTFGDMKEIGTISSTELAV